MSSNYPINMRFHDRQYYSKRRTKTQMIAMLAKARVGLGLERSPRFGIKVFRNREEEKEPRALISDRLACERKQRIYRRSAQRIRAACGLPPR